MILILGLQPKLRLENKSGLGECFKIKDTLTSVRVSLNLETFSSGFPTLGDFGNLSLVES
jgi:hypothetical protein